MKSERVKKKRPYDASGRLAQAQRTREVVLDVARDAFLGRGYAATTIGDLAREAGVSVETIYKTFGGKPGLVRALFERALAGQGPRAAPERSNELSSREEDPRAIVRGWGTLTAEVSPIVSPILLLLRTAATSDPELAKVLAETDEARLVRMRQNAKRLADRGFLRNGMSVERAAQIMWAHASPELYDMFVLRLGWTPRELGTYVGEALEALLL
jgi:AcrR family transcriptional regulator